ncbi:MAG: hypothetical protein QOC55_2827 [Thermoleophilaceae bacterium]|nr:hypothetical protein [Thermoleophilaceae bacterium]
MPRAPAAHGTSKEGSAPAPCDERIPHTGHPRRLSVGEHLLGQDGRMHEEERFVRSGGVFGLDDVVGDFDAAGVEAVREIAQMIRTPAHDDVRSAMALAGSAAQSKFQLFPGDCDFFERVHIHAPSREEAIALLASTMIQTVAQTFTNPRLQFVEMKLGLYPLAYSRDQQAVSAGSPISWGLAEMDVRVVRVVDSTGETHRLRMHEVALDPGFVKLDWVFADSERDRVLPVSKVIDATWESPDGTIVALDGVLDSFYQEIYLDPDSQVDVERLVQHVSPDGLENYLQQIMGEVAKYSTAGHENYGKVAKRLYNITRILRRDQDASYLRSLFDDPPARLYQVSGTMHALSEAIRADRLDRDIIVAQVAALEGTISDCYTGADRAEILDLVRRLPGMDEDELVSATARISAATNTQVSDYFHEKIEESEGLRKVYDLVLKEAPKVHS